VNLLTNLLVGAKDVLFGSLAAIVIGLLCTLATAEWVLAFIFKPGFKALYKLIKPWPKLVDWIDSVLHLASEAWPPTD